MRLRPRGYCAQYQLRCTIASMSESVIGLRNESRVLAVYSLAIRPLVGVGGEELGHSSCPLLELLRVPLATCPLLASKGSRAF